MAICLLACVGVAEGRTAVRRPSRITRNLVYNGDFEQGERYPDYWECHLTDFITKTIRSDDGHRDYRYICGCGHDLGAVRPWCGLRCPKCRGFLSGQECGSWYVRNHDRVSLVPGAAGKCVKFTLPPGVGNNQGVRIYSNLIRAKRGWGYKLRFSVKAQGAHPRVFVEGYRIIAPGGSRYYSKFMQIPEELDPYKTRRPIERCFRTHVNCGSPRSWKTFSEDVVARRRYQFDWMMVNLYAYLPGEAYFDNVSLTPMSRQELQEFIRSQPKPRDSRFAY